MDLLIDIGNTNLKWAVRKGGSLGAMQTVRHHNGLPIDLHASWEQLPPPHRIFVSNVGGTGAAIALEQACRSHWGLEPAFAATEANSYGVAIAYQQPEHLGVDRWLALIAAHQACAEPVLVLDAGTAITYDLLLAHGHHLGGLILPGIEMMRDGLLGGTHIPRVEARDLTDPWAGDTGSAVAAGSIQAPAALAERLFERLADHAGAQPRCILTGGDAERLIPALHLPVEQIPDLVLRGLALLR